MLFFDYSSFYQKLAARCPKPGRIREVTQDHYRRSRIARGGDFVSFYEGVTRDLSLDMPLEEFKGAYSDIFSANDAMIDLVRSAPRPRFMLSNTDATHIGWIRQRFPQVFPLFDGWVLSFEVGAEKPEEAVYRQVEALSGQPAERHVFVDDVPEYAAAARGCGWHAIEFTTVEDCARRLAALVRPGTS
ncbi:MAG: HAD-IA family hydrolase [Armatimonadota bacterium]